MHGDTTASPAHLDNVTITSTVTIQVPSAEINAICVCVCVAASWGRTVKGREIQAECITRCWRACCMLKAQRTSKIRFKFSLFP